MTHNEISKKGGQVKSEAKTRAARKNAKKSRGKWATAISYVYHTTNTSPARSGVLLVVGKPPKGDAVFWLWARKLIEGDPINNGYPIEEVLEFETRSRLI